MEPVVVVPWPIAIIVGFFYVMWWVLVFVVTAVIALCLLLYKGGEHLYWRWREDRALR